MEKTVQTIFVKPGETLWKRYHRRDAGKTQFWSESGFKYFYEFTFCFKTLHHCLNRWDLLLSMKGVVDCTNTNISTCPRFFLLFWSALFGRIRFNKHSPALFLSLSLCKWLISHEKECNVRESYRQFTFVLVCSMQSFLSKRDEYGIHTQAV